MPYYIKFKGSDDYFARGKRVSFWRATYYLSLKDTKRILINWYLKNKRRKPLEVYHAVTGKKITDSSTIGREYETRIKRIIPFGCD